MAERRMFAKSITDSARFLKMPLTTQALYFHLGCHADDDGVVEAFSVINLCGAAEDDLKLLVAKGFVVVLNEDLVSYITDWNVHNKLRPDRKIDSAYQDLLLQIIPDVQLLESRERADRKAEKKDVGRPTDDHGTTNGRRRIGKDSIVEDNINIYCSEPQAASKPKEAEAAVINLPLNDGTEYGVLQTDVDKWTELYPAVDVMQGLRNMVGWLDANPTQRKTARGIKRFINNWLSKDQNKGGGNKTAPSSTYEYKNLM